MFASHAVHLLVQHLHQLADVALREDVVAYLADDRVLEALRVEPWRSAGFLAPLEQRLADVVGVFAALGLRGGESPAAALALEQTAQEVGAGGAPGVDGLGGARLQQLVRALELVLRDDGGEGVLDAHGRGLVLGLKAPDQCAGVGLVGEHPVHGVPPPAPASHRRHAVIVENPDDVEDALALAGHAEDAAHDGVGGRVELQLRALLGAVLDVDPAVAVRDVRGDPEAARGRLAHPSQDFLGQVLRVELIDALDDRLHELAGGGVIGVLGDGDHADAAAAEHRLEGDGVLALAGEAGELPDEDLLKGGVGTARRIEHLAELGPVGGAPTLRLIDVLPGDAVAVLLGVVTQRPQLSGDGEIDILAVAGDTGVEGGRGGVRSFGHRVVLLVGCRSD